MQLYNLIQITSHGMQSLHSYLTKLCVQLLCRCLSTNLILLVPTLYTGTNSRVQYLPPLHRCQYDSIESKRTSVYRPVNAYLHIFM